MNDHASVPKKRYWPSGQVMEEWFEVDGVKEGWRRFYLEDGFMFAEMEFRNGKGHGVIREWRIDRSLRLQATLKDGDYHGHFSVWWPNGRLMEDGYFHHGKQVSGYRYYTENGEVWKQVD